jgi:putative flippase GtrA
MIRKIWQHKGAQQLIKYGAVAAFGLAIDFATVIFAKEVLGVYYLLAVCLGFIAGLIATYILSNKYVFGAPKGNPKKTFMLFGVIGVVGLGILNLLVWLMTEKAGINYIASKAIATIAVFMWNFFARRALFQGEDLETAQAA